MQTKNNIEYFHWVSDYRGNRYFKVDWINQKCTQIVIDSGEKKKGRPHLLGVYYISLTSFLGTYYWYFGKKSISNTNLLQTTKGQWDKAVDKIVVIIK